MNESLGVAFLLLIIAIINMFYSIKILLSSYTLTDEGLVCKSFLKKTLTYIELEEILRKHPPYIMKNQHNNEVTLFISDSRKISLLHFCGSYDFVHQLEKKVDIVFERKSAAYKEKPNAMPLITLLILGIALFFLKNNPVRQSEYTEETNPAQQAGEVRALLDDILNSDKNYTDLDENPSVSSTNSNQLENEVHSNIPSEIETEAAYYHVDEHHHKILNARFKFSITMPKTWRAFDHSTNGDGYFIECDNPNVDIRVYGQNDLGDTLTAEEYSEEFPFSSGIVGWITIESSNSITISYRSDGRIIEMYVGYEGEEDWLIDNLETILLAAGSMCDTY